jgi:hypothetical protein
MTIHGVLKTNGAFVLVILVLASWQGCFKLGGSSDCIEFQTEACQCVNGFLGASQCIDGAWSSCDCTGKLSPPVQAGTVGKCKYVEAVEGKKVCILSEPQVFSPEAGLSTLRQPLAPGKADDLPESVELLDSCAKIHIHDQGQTGWCVAHATLGGMELAECLATGSSEKLSEPHLWHLGRGMPTACNGGWNIQSAVVQTQVNAIAPSTTWPAEPVIEICEDDMPAVKEKQPTDEQLAVAGRTRILDHYYLPPHDLFAVKNALRLGHPVVYAFHVLEGCGWFFSDWQLTGKTSSQIELPASAPAVIDNVGPCHCDGTPGDGVSCDPPETYCSVGGHAVLLTGYDDTTETLTIVNSWGAKWPPADPGGISKMTYDYFLNYAKGGTAIQSVRLCSNGACSEPSPPVTDITVPGDDTTETEDSWVVTKEGVTVELPKDVPCLQPGVDVTVHIIDAGEYVGSSLAPRVLPLYTDSRSHYYSIVLEVLDYDKCSWKKELGRPSYEEEPLARVTIPFEGPATKTTSLMRSAVCMSDKDPLFDCGELPESGGPYWHEMEAEALAGGKATFEVPLGLLSNTSSLHWAVADSICLGKRICRDSFFFEGKDPEGMYALQDCDCIEGGIKVATSNLTTLDSTVFSHIIYADSVTLSTNADLTSVSGFNGLQRTRSLSVHHNYDLTTLEPLFYSLTHVGEVKIASNHELASWTSGGGCPTDLEEVCFVANVVENYKLPNCVVNRCIDHMKDLACTPGPWCKRLHQIEANDPAPEPNNCPTGNIYECSNNLNCSCSGNAFSLVYGCDDHCIASGPCDDDLGLECVGFEYDDELGKEVGNCSSPPTFNWECTLAICPSVFGCYETDAPYGDPEHCICD